MSIPRVMIAVVIMLSARPAPADPLYAKNLSPVSGLFGFPNLRNAQTLARGRSTVGLHGNIANNYTVDAGTDESVNFDVETRRLSLRVAFGLGAGWELEAEAPWLRHEGGDLDEAIENWHDLWNLPDGDRDQTPRDLVDVRYAGPGAAFALDDPAAGWGDISIGAVKRLWSTGAATVSARVGVKLATGDEDELTGSGSEDYYLSLNFTGDHRGGAPIVWHGQLGYLRAGDTSLLGDTQEQNLWFAGLGMTWRTSQRLHLKLQVDSHAAVADSALTQLGDTAVQMTAGLGWYFAEAWETELSFSEDIAVDTAPDFVLQLGVRYRPSARREP